MNGPEHYREAERMLKIADESLNQFGMTVVHQSYLIQRAQAHATLALAAATALPNGSDSEWTEVTT